MTTWWPPRSTLHLAAVMVCSASMAASALLSCTTPSTAFSSTTMRMMNTSVKLSPLRALVTADTAAAASSISSMGSFSCARNRWSTEGFSASFSLLGPCLASRSAACSSVSPVGEEPRASSTSCGLRLYSLSIVYYSFSIYLHLMLYDIRSAVSRGAARALPKGGEARFGHFCTFAQKKTHARTAYVCA